VHPILESRQRLILYLTAWIPLCVILTVILKRGFASWPEAAIVAVPMTLLYAFMCLSAWYVCLAAPMRNASLIRVLVTVFAASTLASATWVTIGEVCVIGVEPWLENPGLSARYGTQLMPLFTNGVILYLLAATAHYLLITVAESRSAEKRALELQVLAREAELKALRAQIDPHFLFNSLNSISALTMSDPQGARTMCVLLADFLRTSLVLGPKQQIPLIDELRLVDSFLSIEKIRYGQRLAIVRSVGADCHSCLVPPLLIQPLVENAIRHGIAPLVEGGTVRIDIHRNGAGLEIVLENPMDASGETSPQRGAGVGLENVRSRLSRLFANQSSVTVTQNEGEFQVRLRFPCIESGDTK
jgi:hypothetical protein